MFSIKSWYLSDYLGIRCWLCLGFSCSLKCHLTPTFDKFQTVFHKFILILKKFTSVNLIPELDERMQDLKNELQSFEGEGSEESHRRKALDALKRMENWNLFSDSYEVCYFCKDVFSNYYQKTIVAVLI